MESLTRGRERAVLRWVIASIVTLTLVPVIAVLVVLPFAGKVAFAFQHGNATVMLGSPQQVGRTMLMIVGDPLSKSGNSPDGPTPSAKVTGGGTISAANPRTITFGLVAQGRVGGPAKGNVNYVNHLNGEHINGPVDTIDNVTFFPPDGSGRTKGTVTFTGHDRKTACSYTVKVTDNGEPGTNDRFGLVGCGEDTGAPGVDDSQLSTGNIQLHPTQEP